MSRFLNLRPEATLNLGITFTIESKDCKYVFINFYSLCLLNFTRLIYNALNFLSIW